MHRKLLYILLTACSTSIAAQESSLLLNIAEHDNRVRQMRSYLFDAPSLQVLRSNKSLNDIRAGYSHRSASSATVPEAGDGANAAGISINSYIKNLNANLSSTTLWGGASYEHNKTENICFAETNDVETIYPYVTADCVGGWLKSELYKFRGGASYSKLNEKLNSEITYAIEGEYSARLAYRTIDPRPNNLSSDFKIGFGFGLMKEKHFYAIDIALGKYKQTSSIKTYDQVSTPTFYHLTGAGNDYYRFRGNNTSSYYNGENIGATVTWGRKDNIGLFASAGAEFSDVEKIITSLNQLPLAKKNTTSANAKIGYTTRSERTEWGVAAYAKIRNVKGTENIFGSAQDNIYPQIAQQQMYGDFMFESDLNATVQHHYGKGSLYASAGIGNIAQEEKYESSPSRRFKSDILSSRLAVGGSHIRGRMMYSIGAEARFCSSLKNETEGEKQDFNNNEIYGAWIWRTEYLGSSRREISAEATAEYDTQKKVSVYTTLQYNYQHYRTLHHQSIITVSVGCHF
ncbi:MAG: hypothetical protein J5676_10305 [Bacteroidaceae bacterium]|nr:hypothetical protein [Bacteroidaceae bacterium]